MKKTFTLITCLMVSTMIMAQSTETRQLDNFHGVSSSSSVDVIIKKGSSNTAEIKVRNISLSKVKTEVNDGILEVGMTGNTKWNWIGSKKSVKVVVTYTDELDYLAARASSDLICDNTISGEDLKIEASASSDIECHVEVRNLSVSASASSDVELSGSADTAQLSSSASADILAFGLTARSVSAQASASSDIEITVTERLKASATASADVTYKGNPADTDFNTSASGDVTRAN